MEVVFLICVVIGALVTLIGALKILQDDWLVGFVALIFLFPIFLIAAFIRGLGKKIF